MSRLIAKLGFIHRRLWQRDGTYRAAILLGPPPLVGFALATAIWAGVHGLGPPHTVAAAPPPWAHKPPAKVAANDGLSKVEQPVAPLPPASPDGGLVGLRTGWLGRIEPIEISPTLDVNVLPTPIASFGIDGPDIDLARILVAGPPDGLFVGLQQAILPVRAEGVYGLSIRLERASPESANCLIRLGFSDRRLISNLAIGVADGGTHTYDATELNLRPGLYRLTVVFGCWRGRQVSLPGRVTLMIRHPGEAALLPARSDEVLRPAEK